MPTSMQDYLGWKRIEEFLKLNPDIREEWMINFYEYLWEDWRNRRGQFERIESKIFRKIKNFFTKGGKKNA